MLLRARAAKAVGGRTEEGGGARASIEPQHHRIRHWVAFAQDEPVM
jgi:hypothetical protein